MHNKNRLHDIDKAKGFAIFLVVVGHIVATDMPEGNEWYAALKFYIYKFHMPFFMFISGIIMAYTFPEINTKKDYLFYIYKKLKRLYLGYFLFGVIIYFGKISLSKLIHVDDLPGDIFSETYKLLVVPSKSAGGSLWFIYVLMEMYLVFPLIIFYLNNKPILIILAGVILHSIAAFDTFMLDKFCEYFIFFAIGVILVKYYQLYLSIIDKYFLAFFILFLISFLIIPYLPSSISKTIISFFSLPALHGLMRNNIFSSIPIWVIFGNFTYSIYLMNTIFIGITKGIILKFTTWDGSHFLIVFPILLIFGIYGPIYIKKFILVKIPIIDRATN